MISYVKVGGVEYSVWRDQRAAIATGARGQALPDEARIMLDPRCAPKVQALTLLHEAFHCAFEQSPLTAGKAIKDAVPDVDEVLEEKLCTWLEGVVSQLYRDNKQLFEELV